MGEHDPQQKQERQPPPFTKISRTGQTRGGACRDPGRNDPAAPPGAPLFLTGFFVLQGTDAAPFC